MYSRLPPEADDDRGLTDDNDHAAFSVIVFNEKGSALCSSPKLPISSPTYCHNPTGHFQCWPRQLLRKIWLTNAQTEKIEENGVKV